MTTKSASSHTGTTRTDGAQRTQDRKHMMQPLATIADRWASEEQQLHRSELEIRYRWAMDVMTVQASPDLYGRNAVEALFELRLSRDYEPRVYQSVANYIDDKFFNSVVSFNQSKIARKGHVTWSHLVVFARLGDHAVRQHLLEQCMVEQWSVATLRSKVDEAFDDGVTESTTERRQAGVCSIAKRLARSAKKLEKDSWDIIGEEFRSALGLVRDGDRDETLEQFEAAREAVSDCRVQLGTAEQALDIAMKSLRSKSRSTKAIDMSATESSKIDPTTDDQPLPVKPKKKVRRRIQPVVDTEELVTV